MSRIEPMWVGQSLSIKSKEMKKHLSVVRSVAILVLSAYCLVVASPSSSSGPSANRKAIEQLFAAWNSHDADKVANSFADDAIYEDVAAGHINRGRTDVREWAAGAFSAIENFRIEIITINVHAERGVVEWVWSGTDKGLLKTGKKFSVRGVSVIELRGGKVLGYKEYYDFATVMRQLGVLPDKKD